MEYCEAYKWRCWSNKSFTNIFWTSHDLPMDDHLKEPLFKNYKHRIFQSLLKCFVGGKTKKFSLYE